MFDSLATEVGLDLRPILHALVSSWLIGWLRHGRQVTEKTLCSSWSDDKVLKMSTWQEISVIHPRFEAELRRLLLVQKVQLLKSWTLFIYWLCFRISSFVFIKSIPYGRAAWAIHITGELLHWRSWSASHDQLPGDCSLKLFVNGGYTWNVVNWFCVVEPQKVYYVS